MQQQILITENDISYNIIFNSFKQLVVLRIFNKFQIHFSDDEFKRIEQATIEETKKYFTYKNKAAAAAVKKAKAKKSK
jgi:hypothetical protein